ncbi:MAG: hypothetical protein KKD31_01900 [Bacteroidetes bacterium]|nr:hypothetical protein [Bacteroidota bacterium]
MNSPEIQEFIKEQSHLFWYIPEKDKVNISHEVLVEFIFNYGDMEAVRKLIRIMGISELTATFNKIEGRRKLNFFPEIYNYLSLIIRKHA